ncbi:ATP-dependent helicase [Metabacillus iocasae]|uniref:DNA 3'-5' helicase n=1 Tax=Priestia iocasae TaxID=2291674 RepID=A0ABS2QTL0_9BACI|nr:ATP-dependent helicase [Metabacillus iocasae]MBM7702528.1 DNA helicase-2/ATP-dependent DNA helicase PcrA [Metabacillus iocasae]
MEVSIYQGKPLHLRHLSRERYQSIYEASLRGEVTCQHCSEAVKLYLGIQETPYFFHTHTPHERHECITAVHSSPKKKETAKVEHVERNGFRLPTGRTITASKQLDTTWSSPIIFNQIPVYKGEDTLAINASYSYYDTLASQNIHLDQSQWEAVTHIDGPLLTLAGAGSGKTRVLTARTAFMIQEKKIAPQSIMVVTFTSKAANEMKERLASYPSMTRQHIHRLVMGTFHSIFYRMVVHHDPDKWKMDHLLKWDWQKEQIIKEGARQLQLDEKEFPFDQAIQQISYWKNTLMDVRDIRPVDQWEERAHHLYKHYETTKRQRQLFDFDDMLYGCYELLKNNPALLERYQERLSYFLIDEFQDINKVQYEIMKMLSAKSKNICVVGDDDQSIYAFRGSDPSFILNFERDFPNTKIITLNQNYRSSHPIVASANKVIAMNKARHPKKMVAQFTTDVHPLFFFPYDEEEEATMIVHDIKERIQSGARPSDFAILYRTHSSSRAVFERLTQSHLPFTIEQDADSFYQRRIVRSLLSFLRLSINPNDTNALSDLVSALFLKQSAINDLKAISILHDVSFVEALQHLENLHPFQQKKLKKVAPLFRSLPSMKPLVAIETITKDMGFEDFIKKRGNEGNKMEKGSDDVRDLKVVAKKFTTVQQLLDHVEHMVAMNKEIKTLSKQYQDSVQLTTIHRAKGLEYKHVYVLSSVDGGIPHDYALESYRNGDFSPLEEERRLLYVAMTRAQHSLSLSIPQTRRGKTAYPSRFLKPFMQVSHLENSRG